MRSDTLTLANRVRIAVFFLFVHILTLSVTCGDTLPPSGTFVPPPPDGGVFKRERPWHFGNFSLDISFLTPIIVLYQTVLFETVPFQNDPKGDSYVDRF